MAGNTLNHGQVSVGTTATLIASADADRRSIQIQNLSTSIVYIGSAGVTTSTGVQIPPKFAMNFTVGVALYGVVASGSVTVFYAEEAA